MVKRVTPMPLAAVLIHPESYSLTEKWLHTAIMTIFFAALQNGKESLKLKDITKKCAINLFVEGAKEMKEVGNIRQYRMPLAEVDELIHIFENAAVNKIKGALAKISGKKISDEVNKKVQASAGKPEYVFCVGSSEFCGAVIHFLSVGKEHSENWGFHFLRKLPIAKPGDVIWMQLDEDPVPMFTHGKLADMYMDVHQMFQDAA